MIHFSRNIHYEVEHDSDYQTDCQTYGCGQDDYCRCGRYHSVFPEGLYPTYTLTLLLTEGQDVSKLDKYVLERYLRFKVDHSRYEFEATGDYYGEILRKVEIDSAQYHTNKFHEIMQMSDIDKIRQTLLWEYGKIADSITSYQNATVEILNWNDFHAPHDYRFETAEHAMGGDLYKFFEQIPMGVIRLDEGKHVLVDGYRRVGFFARECKPCLDVVCLS